MREPTITVVRRVALFAGGQRGRVDAGIQNVRTRTLPAGAGSWSDHLQSHDTTDSGLPRSIGRVRHRDGIFPTCMTALPRYMYLTGSIPATPPFLTPAALFSIPFGSLVAGLRMVGFSHHLDRRRAPSLLPGHICARRLRASASPPHHTAHHHTPHTQHAHTRAHDALPTYPHTRTLPAHTPHTHARAARRLLYRVFAAAPVRCLPSCVINAGMATHRAPRTATLTLIACVSRRVNIIVCCAL